MITLNLANKEASDIKFEVSSFPDGQQDIIITRLTRGFVPPLTIFEDNKIIQIKARFNNFKDLELIICAANALTKLGIKQIHLYIPYLLGARSDRQFQEGGNSYLVDIIAPQLNRTIKDSEGIVRNLFSSITVLDVHSNVAPACINNLKMIDNESLVKFAFENIPSMNTAMYKINMENIILISPDAGASHKIIKLSEKIGYKGEIITCSKERDNEGKLTQTVVPNFDLSKDIVIVDDIFDYGTTFKNIGGKMNDMGHQGKKYLIVTHAIQEAGLIDALKWFDGIFTTNSYKEHQIENVKVLNVF